MNGFFVDALFFAVLLFLASSNLVNVKRVERDVWEKLVIAGLLMAKFFLLVLPIHEIHMICHEALPDAHNGWSAFIGMLSFALRIYLLASVSLDLGMLWAGATIPFVRDPFWAASAVDFWSRWGPWPHPDAPLWRRVAAGLALVALLSLRGISEGLAIWFLFHGLFVVADSLLGRYAGRLRMPKLARGVLGAGLFVLSMPLLYKGSWEAAVEEWRVLFDPPARSVYTLFLDSRLTSWHACLVLWGAVLTAVALPGYAWWMERSPPVRKAVRGLGLLSFFALLFSLAVSVTPAFSRLISWWDASPVYIGRDGWLYPVREIDRLTQRRQKPGLAEEVMRLKKELEDQGAKLLLLPVPDKVTLYPEPVLPAKYWVPVLHPGYMKEVERLRAAGVDVLDLTRLFWERRDHQAFYFKQDSHWTAEAMKEVAVQTSRHIRKTYPHVVKDGTPMVDVQFMGRQDIGDLARALTGENFEAQWRAEATQMVGLRGLEDTFGSPVLVLGGSLVRVYDDPDLSFHPRSVTDAPAAFSTQLGALLGRPVEVTDKARLNFSIPRYQGKKLVVWVVRAGEL